MKMNFKTSLVALGLSLLLNGSLFAASPLPASYPDVVDTASGFKLMLQRHYSSPFELGLIIKAEESGTVKKFRARLHEREKKKARQMMESGHQPIGPLEHPAVVNGKMPIDFINLIHGFQKGDFSGVKPLVMTSASLDYRANVESADRRIISVNGKTKTLKNVLVVNSHLTWRHRCGEGCGLAYTEETTTIFDAKGRLLTVETKSQSE
jgi:hypothetical protein